MTGSMVKIIHSGRLPLLRKDSTTRRRLVAFLRRWPAGLDLDVQLRRQLVQVDVAKIVADGLGAHAGAEHAGHCHVLQLAELRLGRGAAALELISSGSLGCSLLDLVARLADLVLDAVGLGAGRSRSASIWRRARSSVVDPLRDVLLLVGLALLDVLVDALDLAPRPFERGLRRPRRPFARARR